MIGFSLASRIGGEDRIGDKRSCAGNQSRELAAIGDKDTKRCKFVSFCTLDGFVKTSVKSLFRMAGTTRLELATSAVTALRE